MRRGLIIYFSQAGNTKKIAQAIHQGMNQRLEQCDIARLREIQPKDLENYDLIGLGSPVWHSRPSSNMMAFIESLTSLEGKHCFYFCTHGAMPGPVISEAVSALRRKNLTVVGAEDWYGSVFLPYMPKPYYTDGHPDATDLKEAEDFGIEMAERSLGISQGATDLIPKLIKGKDYIVDAYYLLDTLKEEAEARSREFKINEEKCTRCLLCVENCPTSNIDLSVSPPVFKTIKCARCWYCEQICPEGAVEYDWGAVTRAMAKHSSMNKIETELEAAEKKGYFRRLVPLEDIGRDTPWYKVSKHPRLVIP
jgi:ferredoxin